jgi:hypothetical protein
LSFCSSNEIPEAKEIYLRFVSGTCIAFMEALLGNNNCEMMTNYIENASSVAPVNVTGSFDVPNPNTKCTPSCTHSKMDFM